MVMLKVMQQYYTATQDRRVIDFMTRYFRYQLDELPKNPLGKWTFWGEQRGGDNLMVVYWLYNITGDKFLFVGIVAEIKVVRPAGPGEEERKRAQ